METIPTAEDIVDYIIKCGDLTKPISREVAVCAIKQKCAYEVEAALKAAAENAEVKSVFSPSVDKESILTAYPPENIK